MNTDRIARSQGKEPGYIPISAAETFGSHALPGAEAYKFFSEWEKKAPWQNKVTIKT